MRLGILATLGICSFLTSSNSQETTWHLGPRRLPLPANASPALQTALAELTQPPAKSQKPPEPLNLDVLRAQIRENDANAEKSVDSLVQRAGVTLTEERLGGVRVYRLRPRDIAPNHKNQLFVHVHGGSFIYFGGRGGLHEAIFNAVELRMEVVSIDYRRAPDDPAPAARDDIVAVWRELVASRPAQQMVMGGSSAGGNLILVATRRILDLGLPAPGALMVGSPVAELANVGDSRHLNEGADAALSWNDAMIGAVALYANGRDYSAPDLSPIHADLRNFPPTYLITGTRDLLLSDTVLVHAKLRRAGVDADLHVYEGIGHTQYLHFLDTPESEQHFAELNAFLIKHLQP